MSALLFDLGAVVALGLDSSAPLSPSSALGELLHEWANVFGHKPVTASFALLQAYHTEKHAPEFLHAIARALNVSPNETTAFALSAYLEDHAGMRSHSDDVLVFERGTQLARTEGRFWRVRLDAQKDGVHGED